MVAGLSLAAAAAAAVPADAAQSASPISRKQTVPGLATPNAPGKPLYSHVVSTTRRKTIHVAGQLARDAQGKNVGVGDAKAQMRQICENLKAALAAEGATLADVVTTTAFITSWDKYREASDVRAEYFGTNLPTATAVQVVALAFPEAMFEVNAVAMVDA
jgi:enamine deaminase RidA (YjgF/YER057c/UK114 family)